MANSGHDNSDHKHGGTHHHILPNKVLFGVGGALLILTVVTVAIAHVDLGRLNFVIAVAVASVKALLVALIFMNLWYDKKENGVIFATSFLFLAIFICFTATDIFFRGDVYVKGPLMAPSTKSKLKNPWISTPELVAQGKKQYEMNCASCHGVEGKGNGPAAAGFNPPPRNFSQLEGWKNGRKVSMVFKTLKEGLPGTQMASFGTLPVDDRWAMVHYVVSLSSTPPEADTPADFAKAGVNTVGGGGEVVEKSISVDLAVERIAQADTGVETHLFSGNDHRENTVPGSGASVYQARCVQCHGEEGQGGIKVQSMSGFPAAYVTTRPFSAQVVSSAEFKRIVAQGLTGSLMPGNGQLSGAEMSELQQYVRNLRGTR